VGAEDFDREKGAWSPDVRAHFDPKPADVREVRYVFTERVILAVNVDRSDSDFFLDLQPLLESGSFAVRETGTVVVEARKRRR
jgi:hypothetical protein